MKKNLSLPTHCVKADNGNGIKLIKSVATWYFLCSRKCKRNVKGSNQSFYTFWISEGKNQVMNGYHKNFCNLQKCMGKLQIHQLGLDLFH